MIAPVKDYFGGEMPRKDFHNVRIAKRIYEALEPLRKEYSKGTFKEVSMNGFCEQILWDYAQGRLIRREQSVGSRLSVDAQGEFVESQDRPGSEAGKETQGQSSREGKRTRRLG